MVQLRLSYWKIMVPQTLCQDTLGEWIIKLGSKNDYDVKNYYMDGHENNDGIRYIWNLLVSVYY